MKNEELLIKDIINEYDITEEECEIHKIVMNYLKERAKEKNWSNHRAILILKKLLVYLLRIKKQRLIFQQKKTLQSADGCRIIQHSEKRNIGFAMPT